MIRRLIAGEDGQALVEYGLIAAVLLLAIVITAKALVGLQGKAYTAQQGALQKWRAP